MGKHHDIFEFVAEKNVIAEYKHGTTVTQPTASICLHHDGRPLQRCALCVCKRMASATSPAMLQPLPYDNTSSDGQCATVPLSCRQHELPQRFSIVVGAPPTPTPLYATCSPTTAASRHCSEPQPAETVQLRDFGPLLLLQGGVNPHVSHVKTRSKFQKHV